MKKIMSKLHFRSIYKTIVLTLILCFVYNIAYLMMSASGAWCSVPRPRQVR